MIDSTINLMSDYNARYREEDLLLEKLRTHAEGLSSRNYEDDTSRGGSSGENADNAKIRLIDTQTKIAKKRWPRFELTADVCDYLYDRLKPQQARVMEMYVVDCMTYRDIADRIGKSAAWVSNIVNDSKKILKRGCKQENRE